MSEISNRFTVDQQGVNDTNVYDGKLMGLVGVYRSDMGKQSVTGKQ